MKQRANFVARVDSTEPNIKYRFDFGDRSGVTAWQSSPQTAHTYSSAGTYPARVDIQVQSGQSGLKTASSKLLLMEVRSSTPPRPTPVAPIASPTTPSPSPTASPTATPTPNSPLDGGSSDDWWKYLLAALILFAGYQGWKAFHAPRPTLVPNVDPGDSQLKHGSGALGINFQMELNPNISDSQVAVNTDGGSLIKSERKSDG
jgi:hypothetical protein